MHKETLFLEYLDGQLDPVERSKVDEMILVDPDCKKIFQDVQNKKQKALDALDDLNPDIECGVPSAEDIFEKARKQKEIISVKSLIIRYAAAVALFVTIGLSYYILNKKPDVQLQEFVGLKHDDTNVFYNEEINYYISPNRCWNQRELVWTVIELNQ